MIELDEIFYKNTIDNDARRQYIELLESSRKEGYDCGDKSERHHAVPRSLYKMLGIEINNTDSNIFTLKYEDHQLAHKLLAEFTEGDFNRKMSCASAFMNREYMGDLIAGDKNPSKRPEVKAQIAATLSDFYNSEEGVEVKNKANEARAAFYNSEEGKKVKEGISESLIKFYNSEEGKKVRESVSTKISKYLTEFNQTEEGKAIRARANAANKISQNRPETQIKRGKQSIGSFKKSVKQFYDTIMELKNLGTKITTRAVRNKYCSYPMFCTYSSMSGTSFIEAVLNKKVIEFNNIQHQHHLKGVINFLDNTIECGYFNGDELLTEFKESFA